MLHATLLKETPAQVFPVDLKKFLKQILMKQFQETSSVFSIQSKQTKVIDDRSSRVHRYFIKNTLRDLEKFTGKLLRWSLKVAGCTSTTSLKQRLQYWCLPTNYKFLRAPFLKGHLWISTFAINIQLQLLCWSN